MFDDLPFFMVDNAGNQPVSNYHFSLFELRSLPYATLAWTKSWFGLELIYFRVGNLLLHVATVIALFFLITSLLTKVCGEHHSENLNPRYVAFCTALIFALHPVTVYAVAYLAQRTILMSTLFSLLAMLAYLHGSVKRQPWWLWASVSFYYLAVLSKEHAIMLPAVLLVLTILLHPDWRIQLRQRWGVFATLAVIALFVIVAKQGLVGSAYEINAPEMLDAGKHPSGSPNSATDVSRNLSYLMSVLTQSWLFFKYIALWLLPNPAWMSVDMREPFAKSLLSPYLLAFAGYIAWGIAGLWLLVKRGRMGLLGFAMLFPWLMFMTEFSTVRIQESFVLYRSYLWAVGLCCGMAVMLSCIQKRMAVIIVGAVVLMMLPASMDRLRTFSHPLLLWDDAERLVQGHLDFPGVNRIYYNRGTELSKVAKYDLAIDDFKQSIILQPNEPYSYHNLGAVYLKKEQWREAAEAFTNAIAVGKATQYGINPRSYFGRAEAYQSLNEIGKAKLDYIESCRLINKGCDKI